MGLFILVVGANALQAFVTTGPPPFMGQADPLRFSWNPGRWVWLWNDELGGPISLRGSWTVPMPDPSTVEGESDPALGPVATEATLPILGWEEIGPSLNGRLTDLARDPATGRFLAVTEEYWVYVLDPSLSTVVHSVHLDPYFAVDIRSLAGAAFMGDTLALGTINKSYLLLRPDPGADEDFEWRHFLETSGAVSELRRSRFATVRARQMYVSSLAYDPDAGELITVTVPSPRHRRMVVSRFDARDFMLSSEFMPRLAPGVTFVGDGRSLAEYAVTGTEVVDGKLYAMSAAYSTLLVMDLDSKTVTGAYGVTGVLDPVGLASRGDELLIAQADGRIAVVKMPGEEPAEPEAEGVGTQPSP
jgi:disulfide bond formation protein DsbB